ncbi:SIR2 family NAD-dependent protein deacylase [Pseudomonas sp. EpS/L25]|uniref:SIR2 family NAD-dependent protein deacylase n=1 Tax=Pseudomonas sp. EpS/L25 TaxID=1749078 RepID=UPI0007435137|nr:NAD-dependent deacylase [Pseudomonas sp. EpS/L25]KUM41340.1 NAD-dependent deacylase [Pseudomonas sp. EpS/L25]
MPAPLDCRTALPTLPPALLERLRTADEVLVLTGAGVSAESGIATFREALTGLWARFDPAQLATTEAFVQDPARVWGWYEWRRRQALEAQPNAAHRALAAWAERHGRLRLVTQNVDDLHERAGSRDVIHLHGSLHAPRCFDCARPLASPALPKTGDRLLAPPRCPACGGPARPGVVWFGESLPAEALATAWDLAERCDLCLVIGTSGLVQPAASLPVVARQRGATVVRIDPQPAADFGGDWQLLGAAGAILPALLERL